MPADAIRDLPATIADTAAALLPTVMPYAVALAALWLIVAVGLRLLRGAGS